MEQLDLEFRNLKRSGSKAALMYLDLDDFKKINDTLGHNAGDQLLIEVANRIKRNVRDSDTISRLGGDEYAVLIREVSKLEDCQVVAEKILAEVGSEMEISGSIISIGLSIGITLFPDKAASVREVLNHADLALYESKKLGKNQISYFNQAMQQSASERQQIELELQRAIIHGEFELFFQPIIRLENRQMVMLEALLRWNHPQNGLIGPNSFISIAEQCGLINEIGEWVIIEACRTITHAIEQGESLMPIAINVSGKTVM